MQATQKDLEFLAEIEKSQSEFGPAPGQYLQDLAKKVAATSPEIFDRASNALQP